MSLLLYEDILAEAGAHTNESRAKRARELRARVSTSTGEMQFQVFDLVLLNLPLEILSFLSHWFVLRVLIQKRLLF